MATVRNRPQSTPCSKSCPSSNRMTRVHHPPHFRGGSPLPSRIVVDESLVSLITTAWSASRSLASAAAVPCSKRRYHRAASTGQRPGVNRRTRKETAGEGGANIRKGKGKGRTRNFVYMHEGDGQQLRVFGKSVFQFDSFMELLHVFCFLSPLQRHALRYGVLPFFFMSAVEFHGATENERKEDTGLTYAYEPPA